MLQKHDFYGSTTVGERGQIVVPKSIRDELNIEPGDKLLVFGVGPGEKEAILIVKAEMLGALMERMIAGLQELMKDADEGD